MIGMGIGRGRATFLELALDAQRLDDGLRADLRATANEAKAEAVGLLTAPGRTGRRYGGLQTRYRARRGRGVMRESIGRRVWQASAPGEAPARVTGTLARSLRAGLGKKNKYSGFVIARSATGFYGLFLDRGARRIKPRPFLQMLLPKYEAALAARLEKRIDSLAK